MSNVGPAVPRYPLQDDDSIAENIVSAEPQLTIIKFYTNNRGQTFFRIAGMDPEANLQALMEDLGTENPNVINALLCDIRKMAMTPEGEMDLDIFHSILAKVCDEKPRTARARQLAVQKAAMENLFFTRVKEFASCQTIDQDSNGANALKTITKLSIELSETADRERNQSPAQVLNVVNIGEGAPTVVAEAPRQQAIEYNPQPAFEGPEQHQKDDMLVQKAETEEDELGVVSSSPASKQHKPRQRYRPKAL
jgi:hypothetical protein